MESSATNLLNLTPEKTLEFQVVGGQQSAVVLTLENPGHEHVAFKIKTTAPKSYLVKPSSGVVKPASKLDIHILLIPLFEPPKEPCGDRFLVQATLINENRSLSKEEWTEVSNNKHLLDERRLNVTLRWQGFPTGENNQLTTLIGEAVPTDYPELKARFEELLTFCVALEKQKKEIMHELDELRRGSKSSGGGKKGYELWQVILAMLVAVVLGRLVRFL